MSFFRHAMAALAKSGSEFSKRVTDPDAVLQMAMSGLIHAAKQRAKASDRDVYDGTRAFRLLFAGYTGVRNTGADVRVEEMVKQFRHVLGDANLSMSILTLDASRTRGYFQNVQQVRLPEVFPKFLYDRMGEADGVVACEGSMFKSKFASALSTMMTGALGLANAEGKASIAYGGEAGEMSSHLQQFVQENARDSLVITRNRESKAVLEKLGIQSSLGTDTAWTFDVDLQRGREVLLREGWDGEKPLLVVCPIHPFWWPVKPDPFKAMKHRVAGMHEDSHYRSVYFHERSKESEEQFKKYIREIARGIRKIARERNMHVAVVGMEALDREACELLKTHLGSDSSLLVSDDFNMHELVSVLRNAELLVSSRYHAIVCSMPAGVPSVGITMDERIRNILRDRNEEHLCLRVDEVDLAAKLEHAIDQVSASRADSIRSMERAVALHLCRMAQMGVILARYFGESFPKFPLPEHSRTPPATFEELLRFLPPLGERQRKILAAHGQEAFASLQNDGLKSEGLQNDWMNGSNALGTFAAE